MTGFPLYNYPAFRRAAGQLHRAGFEVLCPTDINPREDFSERYHYTHWARLTTRQLTYADAVAVLDGYTQEQLDNSTGYQNELRLAKLFNMQAKFVSEWLRLAAQYASWEKTGV